MDGITARRESADLRLFSVIAFGLVCCLLYGTGAAIRCNVGILLNPLSTRYAATYEEVSFCIAVMQLMFGASQPFFGALAARKSNRFVLFLGLILIAASLAVMATATSLPLLMLSLGVVFGAGAGAVSFGLVLTSAIFFVGQKNAMTISGMLNAAAGLLGFVMAPLMQTLLASVGLPITLLALLGCALLLVPVAILVTSHDPKQEAKSDRMQEATEQADTQSMLAVVRDALRNRTYRLLIAGFGTCGFHMVIIESHLFSQFMQYGIDPSIASWAFSVYSLATIAGALLSGWLSGRVSKGGLLTFYYGFRAVWTLAYLFLMPKTVATAVVFAIGLGATGDATVSPTSGLVNQHFKLGQIATLIGVLFLCHQVGAFFSAWLGGVLLKATGDYIAIWMVDVALCAFAAAMSSRIVRGEHRLSQAIPKKSS